jgi:PAS domain S-box-containing protein
MEVLDVMEPLRILLIEDNENDAELVMSRLEQENIGILRRVETAEQMTLALKAQCWDLILADYALAHFDALAALQILKSSLLDIPFIVVARTVGEARAIEMMKAGANDFVLKTDLSRLVPCIHRELAEAKNRAARKEAEGHLKNRELQLSVLLENAYNGIVTTESHGRIVEFNRAAEEIFKLGREDALGTSFWQLIDPEKKLTAKEKDFSKSLMEFTLRRADGTDLHLEISTIQMAIAEQPLMSYFIRDVTEPRNQQRALLESESNFRKLADCMPQIVWTSGEDGSISYVNQRWYDYTGLTPQQTLGGTAESVLHPDDLENTMTAHISSAVSGTPMAAEARLRGTDGSYRWFLIRSTAIRDHNNRITRWYGTFTDIHEQKLAAEELEHAKNLAENANRAKSNFLANMSHEIRTPLGAILGFAELMADPEQPAQERLEYIEIIKRNGDQLSRVISEILDLSKVESDRLQIERIGFSLPELLRDVTTLLSLQAQEKNLTLNLKFNSHLPAFIVSDPTRLRQILINIVGNAIKFTERGEITLSATPVKTDGEVPECIRFTISDTGLGISEDQAKNLFEAFMQGDSSTTRKFGGTGLGLALSRRLARALGGDLVLQQSEVGKGSTFTFTIESGLTEKQQKENQTEIDFSKALPPVSPKEVRRGPNLKGSSILVVDDSPDNCSLISYILTRAGAKVDTRNDGKSACEQALKNNYDLVFMDIQMPKMDGFEAAQYLLSQEYSKPLVAITAHAMKGDRERCLNTGFKDHLTKPIDRTLLLDIASRLMEL